MTAVTTALPAPVLDARPQVGNAGLLARAHNQRLLTSLARLCRTGNGPDGRGDNLAARLGELDPDRKLPPELFDAYFRLLDAHLTGGAHPGLEDIEAILSRPRCEGLSVRRLRRSGWLLSQVIEPHELQAPAGRPIRFGELPEVRFARERPRVEDALSTIATVHAGMADEVERLLSRLFLFEGTTVVGLTGPRFHGAMLLSAAPAEDAPESYYIEHIVHEVSHMYLNTVLGFDGLLMNGGAPGFKAPIRSDRRPLLGVFHATFVLFRIVAVLGALADRRDGPPRRRILTLRADRSRRLQQGLEVIGANARLTPWGQRLFATMRCVPS